MAKRRKRKHRPSARYITFAQRKNQQSIIPTITITAKTSKVETKLIRDSIRKAFSEQQKVITPKPSSTYNSNKKKNRREARQRRKEKKQKRKEQRKQEQTPPSPPQTIQVDDYTVDAETGEILDYDDSENYFDQLEAELMQVYQQILDEYSWDEHVYQRFSSIDRALYWISDARQLPYEIKQGLMAQLEQSVHLEEIHSILAYRYYEEMVNASEDIASTIQAVVESFL